MAGQVNLVQGLLSAQNSPSVSVVIPTLNEAGNIPHVLPRIPNWVDEVVLVDGHSTDRTVEVARNLHPDVCIVMQEGHGKGDALRTGFAAATGDIIVTLDADCSTSPAELAAFIGALLAGADFAKGSRFLQGGASADIPFHRRLGNKALVILVRLLFGGAYTDLCYGYNAFWASALPQLGLDADGFEIETQISVRALCVGLHVVEIPSFEARRLHGDGKLKAIPDGWRVLKTILREYWKHHCKRAPREQKPVAYDDEFASAMRLLFHEGVHLVRRRKDLPSRVYRHAVETFKAACQALLDLEAVNPESRLIQEYYHKNCDDALWSLVELE